MNYPITFRQLEIFREVARCKSFTKASDRLHLSQPAVSMQVKQIENLIDAPLTEKIAKGLFLTDVGKIMLEYAEQMLSSKRSMEETLTSLKGAQTGHLRLAVPETANQFVTLMLAEFRRLHSGISFDLQIHNRRGLLNCLKENTADLVIMGQTPTNMDLTTQAFMNNPLVIICPSDHPLGDRKQIKLNELVDTEFVVREEGSGTRIAMQTFFSKHQVKLKTSMILPNNEAIKQAVSAGLGLGIVSLHTLQQELALDQVKVLAVKEMPIMRIWYLVHQSQKVISPAMKVFQSFIAEQTQALWTKKYPQLLKHLG